MQLIVVVVVLLWAGDVVWLGAAAGVDMTNRVKMKLVGLRWLSLVLCLEGPCC